MRITDEQQSFFAKEIPKVLPNADVFLFGSRVSDSKKGGDIDILIIGDRKLTLNEKLDIKRAFYNQFGEQKLDLVCFAREEDSIFKTLALDDAVALNSHD